LGGLIESQPGANGYSRALTGLWRRQFNGFSIFSFHPEILAMVSEQLRFEEAPRPAQVWIRAEDLANSRLAPLINAYGYRQSRQIAEGNTRYMNMLVEQLHVPPPDAMKTAEALLDARLLEPLGGKYELQAIPGGPSAWVSTSLVNNPSNSPPADYQFPALNWLRGVELELAADGNLLAVHGELIMPVETKAPSGGGLQLPSLPFGLGKPAAPKDPAKDKAKPKLPAPSNAPAPQGQREF
jgi:hypothetical protein